MSDDSFNTQKKLIDFAIKHNIKISFNPGKSQLKEGLSGLKKILENTYFLSMNKEESKFLFGRFITQKKIFKKLHDIGVKIVCITNGKKGGVVSSKDLRLVYYYKPMKIKAVEITGAGDAFNSSFLVGLIKTNDIEFAIKLAILNSESVIQEVGAKNGILTMGEANKILKTRNFKIKTRKL
jgi:sugar/nucleoside kinase (ribokinase family)